MSRAETSLLQHLAVNSVPYHDPLSRLDWNLLSREDYWLPPEAISLHGAQEFDALHEVSKKRLSHYEFVAFTQAGLWLEEIFMQRLGSSLWKAQTLAEHAYSLHEIREEAGHSLMFLQLMHTSGLHLPEALRPGPRFADFIGRHAPCDSMLFWLAVVVGEEVPDKLNRYVRHHADLVSPLIRDMCTLHVIDEARHLAHARDALERKLRTSGRLRRQLLTPLIKTLITQFVKAFYLPRAEIYELAGLNPGKKWRAIARASPARREFVSQCINPTLNFLKRHGFEVAEPAF
ncbi:MAG: diiron oxygenase [Burkholderiales bacterium]